MVHNRIEMDDVLAGSPENDRIGSAVRSHDWFSQLDAGIQDFLYGKSKVKRYRQDEIITIAGENCDGLSFVIAGMVLMISPVIYERVVVPHVVDSNQWYGVIEVLTGSPYPLTAISTGDTTILFIGSQDINEACDAWPGLWRDLGVLLARQTSILLNSVVDLMCLPAPTKVARRLVAMAEYREHRDISGHRRIICITHDQLGCMLAISRQVVSKVLNDLEAEGIIQCGYKQIGVLDMELLKAKAACAGGISP